MSLRRVIVFTGANRGLGRHTAELLARNSERSRYHIILTGRNLELVEKTIETIS